MNKKQTLGAVVLGALLVAFGLFLNSRNAAMPLHLITGLAFGYILAKSSYGFAGGIKLIYLTGDGTLTRALLIMLAFTLIMTTGVHWAAAKGGAVAAFLATEGQAVIPGTGNVNAVSLNLIIGGLLFGVGMIFAGGCASGTLTGLGTGWGGSLIAILFFGFGGLLGDLVLGVTKGTFMDKGPRVYFPEKFGYIGGFLISMLLILIAYGVTQSYESKRRKDGTINELPTIEPKKVSTSYKFLSEETYDTFFGRAWSRNMGAIMISAVFIFVLVTTGANWGVSGPYAVWAARLLQIFGINPAEGAMAATFATASGGILNHGVSIRNIGIILGSTLAVLLSGVFEIDFHFSVKDALFYAVGGILMGIGAKMARGCNVGAFYSAIVSFSLSGWVFMLTLLVGGVFAMKMFAGKFNLVPKREHDK